RDAADGEDVLAGQPADRDVAADVEVGAQEAVVLRRERVVALDGRADEKPLAGALDVVAQVDGRGQAAVHEAAAAADALHRIAPGLGLDGRHPRLLAGEDAGVDVSERRAELEPRTDPDARPAADIGG